MPLPLKAGDAAPDFSAPVSGGGTLSLESLKGQPVVLYFYPRDDTPGCTKEACGFRDHHEALLKRKAVVLGVSPDEVKAHDRFAAKFALPFRLISDPTHAIAEAYGVWGEKRFMGRKYLGVHRTTFLIGADGRIVRIWDKVKPEAHAAEVLDALS
jgi:peroxiredoxin Q/BCP